MKRIIIPLSVILLIEIMAISVFSSENHKWFVYTVENTGVPNDNIRAIQKIIVVIFG